MSNEQDGRVFPAPVGRDLANGRHLGYQYRVEIKRMSANYPEVFARFYDLIYSRVRDGVDTEFYLSRIEKMTGKTLEIGAGTGRFFLSALNRGADIYGIDISSAMLGVLRSKLSPAEHHRISLQDFTTFRFDFGFDLIIAPFRVFMHLLKKDEQLLAVDNAWNHLNPGGTLIFDVFIPDLKQLITGLDALTDFEGEYEPGKKVRRITSTKPDLLNQLIHVMFRLEWDESGGRKSAEWGLPLRYFFRFELEHLVERSKFTKYDIFGDFEGNPLRQDSKEFIVCCNK